MIAAIALGLAWLLDALFGEPPNALHPVAWLGSVLGPIGRAVSGWSPGPAFVGGMTAWLVVAFAVCLLAFEAQRWLMTWPAWAAVTGLALLLKPCFAWRMLRDEVRGVEQALGTSVEAGRARVARLASRDVSAMDEAGTRETAIETLAENLNDSVVAPLFWFAVAGLPGAAVYRFVNTADAMWGYRGRFEWAGKWAAWADDALSWIPARITAALLLPRDWHAVRSEARQTPSPNGGWPMAAMALRLGVRLRKPGVYELNAATLATWIAVAAVISTVAVSS